MLDKSTSEPLLDIILSNIDFSSTSEVLYTLSR